MSKVVPELGVILSHLAETCTIPTWRRMQSFSGGGTSYMALEVRKWLQFSVPPVLSLSQW